MSINLAIRAYAETLRTVAFGSISGTYAGIGSALAHPSRLIHITNTTDVALFISLDGINDHDIVPINGFLLLDVSTNRVEPGAALMFAQGQRFYVKGAPSSGAVYLATYYGTPA